MEKKERPACGVIFLASLCLAVFIVSGAGRSFTTESFLQDLKVLAVILGGCALALVAFVIFGLVSGRLQSRIIKKSREYLARAFPVELEKSTVLPIPADLPETPGQASIHPVCLSIFIANHGLCLAALTPGSRMEWVPWDNADRFRQLSGDFSGRIVIPQGYYYLYYTLIRQEGDLALESAPPNQAGYSGTLPDPLGVDQLNMVIIYNAVRAASHPLSHERTFRREQPLKLKLVVVDKEGQDDLAATCDFYNALHESMQPGKSEEDDESWLYGPRPWWHY